MASGYEIRAARHEGWDRDPTIVTSIRDSVGWIEIRGDFDTFFTNRFNEEVSGLLQQPDQFGPSVVVDLSRTNFIDVGAVKALYSARLELAAAEKKLSLHQPPEILQILLAALNLTPDLELKIKEVKTDNSGPELVV